VQGLGFRVQGLGFRIRIFRVNVYRYRMGEFIHHHEGSHQGIVRRATSDCGDLIKALVEIFAGI